MEPTNQKCLLWWMMTSDWFSAWQSVIQIVRERIHVFHSVSILQHPQFEQRFVKLKSSPSYYFGAKRSLSVLVIGAVSAKTSCERLRRLYWQTAVILDVRVQSMWLRAQDVLQIDHVDDGPAAVTWSGFTKTLWSPAATLHNLMYKQRRRPEHKCCFHAFNTSLVTSWK